MAKPITFNRRGRRFVAPAQHPEVGPVEFFNPPTGIDVRHPPSRLGPGFSPGMTNFRPINEWLGVRPGAQLMGDVFEEEVLHLAIFTTAIGTEHILAWTTNGLWRWANEWLQLTGPVLDLGQYGVISATSWGDKLNFTDGRTGIYEVNFNSYTYSLIVGSPICRHITTFTGRLIASHITTSAAVLPTRIQWSVKNDNTDWEGVGSGFEDLLSSPGGKVDTQLGVYPVNDTFAYIMRSGSVWGMESTGYFDTPFLFSFLYGNLNVDSPRAVLGRPEGIYFGCRDDIYFLELGAKPRRISTNVRDRIYESDNASMRMMLEWDEWAHCLLVATPPAPGATGTHVFRCYQRTVQDDDGVQQVRQAWYMDQYPFAIKSLANNIYRRTLSISELTGTIGELEGPIRELGVQPPAPQLLFATANGGVLKEADGYYQDIYPNGPFTTIAYVTFSLQTPEVIPTWPLLKTTVVQSQLEYDAAGTFLLTVTESQDGGSTWNAYASNTTVSGHAQSVVFYGARDAKAIMFKLTSSTEFANSHDLKIRSWAVFAHKFAAPKGV